MRDKFFDKSINLDSDKVLMAIIVIFIALQSVCKLL